MAARVIEPQAAPKRQGNAGRPCRNQSSSVSHLARRGIPLGNGLFGRAAVQGDREAGDAISVVKGVHFWVTAEVANEGDLVSKALVVGQRREVWHGCIVCGGGSGRLQKNGADVPVSKKWLCVWTLARAG